MVTIGIEIETTNLALSSWIKVKKPYGWVAVTDGSIRTKQSRYTKVEDCIIHAEAESFGAEMVSPIIRVNADMWDQILPIFSLVQSSGEVARANNSIHIHVSLPVLMSVVKRWKWLQEVDKILYDVSAPEGIPRGIYNDFIYYRPLVSPQWAYTGYNTYSPSIGRVENAQCQEDLEFVFGRYDRKPPKWYPSRYCGINVVSYFSHSTLEFRHFNFTADFSVFKSWVLLCIGIVAALVRGDSQVSPDYFMYLGAKESGSSLKKMALPYNDIFRKINLDPIRTHTERTIYWEEPSNVENPDILIPRKHLERIREVHNAHPSNILSPEREKSILYVGGMHV